LFLVARIVEKSIDMEAGGLTTILAGSWDTGFPIV
jgi:hypothetical protein